MLRRFCLVASLVLYSAVIARAQPDRIAEPIDGEHAVAIAGDLPAITGLRTDEGPLDPSFPIARLTLFLKPSAKQQTALDQLLLDLQDPDSPNYHQWLEPEEYAFRFGFSLPDVTKITDWLQREGFTVKQVARGRSWIAFNGTAGAVQRAFHADLHRHRVAGKLHYANASNPRVPQALEGIVGAIGGLDDFLPQPDYTAANGTHSLAPDDLATIYDFAPLLQEGIDGAGQKVVVVGASDLVNGASDIALIDYQAYLTQFNLPAPNLQQIPDPNFPDPLLTDALAEAVGDLQTISGVARKATILYVYSADAYDALIYAVDQNLAPVVTASYHVGCDASTPASLKSSYQRVAQQANAQGITWVNSSGDSGATGCDPNGSAIASQGLATRFPADIPEVTAVGGTEFDDQTGSYWAPANDANGASALSYIPEVAWNDDGGWASGGGASAFFKKPAWQTGPGVPDDGKRDVPDVALTASFLHDPYLVVFKGAPGFVGGTSASAPAFAGMLVLLNHYLVANGAQRKAGLGNVNQMLYGLAQTSPAAFHDITSGNNMVECQIGSPDCTSEFIGYSAGPGFDLATGLGSVDLANLAVAALSRRPCCRRRPPTEPCVSPGYRCVGPGRQ
jgi:subtilase family serine protease